MSVSDEGTIESQGNDDFSRQNAVPDNKITLAIKIKIVSAVITVGGSALMALTICLWCHGFVPDNMATGHRDIFLIPPSNMKLYFGETGFEDTTGNHTNPDQNQTHPWMYANVTNNTGNHRYPDFRDGYPPINKTKYPGLRWEKIYPGKDKKSWEFPPDVVRGGTDTDALPIYVARALFAGDLIPGKAIHDRTCMYVSRDKFETRMNEHFEILCGSRWGWVRACCGQVPKLAVEAGWTNYNETLYICKVTHGRTTTTGKVHPSHNSCYIPYDGLERRYTWYKILVAW